MGGLRTSFAAVCLTLAASGAGAEAFRPDLGRIFAACAGRYSALTEHLWLHDGPASEDAARRRDLFVELAEAAAEPALALNWRVAAKAAQRHLLDAAAFGPQGDAGRHARAALAACDRLLLGH